MLGPLQPELFLLILSDLVPVYKLKNEDDGDPPNRKEYRQMLSRLSLVNKAFCGVVRPLLWEDIRVLPVEELVVQPSKKRWDFVQNLDRLRWWATRRKRISHGADSNRPAFWIKDGNDDPMQFTVSLRVHTMHTRSFPRVAKMLGAFANLRCLTLGGNCASRLRLSSDDLQVFSGLCSLSIWSIDLDLRTDFHLPSLRELSLRAYVTALPTSRYLFSARALPNLEVLAAECYSHSPPYIAFPDCIDPGLLQQLSALQFHTVACPTVARLNLPHLSRLFELDWEITDRDLPSYLRPDDCVLLGLFSEDGWHSSSAEEQVSETVEMMTEHLERCGPFRAIFLPLFLHPKFTVGRGHHDASSKLLKLMEDRNVEVVWRMKPHVWGNPNTVSADFLDYLKRRGLWRKQAGVAGDRSVADVEC